MTKSSSSKAGFTLLEILLVVGIIAILAGIVILAINHSKQLGDTRNAQRQSDVLAILNAVYQYSLDHNGNLNEINGGSTLHSSETCDENGTDATDLAYSLVGASSTYLTAIPHDPAATNPSLHSEYYVVRKGSGRIIVCINPNNKENNVSIEVER